MGRHRSFCRYCGQLLVNPRAAACKRHAHLAALERPPLDEWPPDPLESIPTMGLDAELELEDAHPPKGTEA